MVVGVNVSDEREISRQFLSNHGVTFPNILDSSMAAEKARSQDYGVGSIPLNYLIDRRGIVVDGWIGYLERQGAGKRCAGKTLGLSAASSQP